jgi:hypothetical protein
MGGVSDVEVLLRLKKEVEADDMVAICGKALSVGLGRWKRFYWA